MDRNEISDIFRASEPRRRLGKGGKSMTKFTRRVCGALLSATLLLPAMGAGAQDIRQREMRFAMSLAPDHPLGVAGQKFADRVSERSGGKLTVSFYPGAVLGSDQQNLSAVRGGTLDFTIMATGLLAGLNKEFMVFDLPFLFNDSEEAYALSDGPVGQGLMEGLSEQGIHGLGIWDLGFRNMTNSRRPITKVEDFKGLKLRVIAAPERDRDLVRRDLREGRISEAAARDIYKLDV